MKNIFRAAFLLTALLVLSEFPVFAEIETKLTGTHRLDSFAHGMPKPRTLKPTREKPVRLEVGTSQIFKTFNFATSKWEETTAELMAIGENIYVYLEAGRNFDEKMLNKLVKEFDENIYRVTTRYFGYEARPGIDNDNHISILLMDIKDDFEQSKTYTSGYFNRGDCYLPQDIPADVNLQSNCREMLYIDISPSDVESDEFFATIAHEFQHLIHFYHDSEEYSWLNEGCSQITTYLCGYGHPRQLEAFLKAPDNSLVAWAPWNQVANYGQVYLWAYFVMNQFCQSDSERVNFFRALVDDQEKGMSSFDRQFARSGSDFATVFADFSIAGFLNRAGIFPEKYGFTANLPDFQLPATAFFDRYPVMFRNSVSIWGSDLIKAKLESGVKKLRVDFAGDLNSLPNSFAVALVFVNEAQSRVNAVNFINNIKSTTRSKVRVMLPGDNDGFPPPPPVKTQMGHLVAEVPDNSDCLYLVIMGKGPADLPDSMLAWSGRANYRVDISLAELEAIVPSTAVTGNVDALLKNYRLFQAAEDLPGSEELFQSINQEILSQLKTEMQSSEKPLTSAISAAPDLSSLKKLVDELNNFNLLHR